MGCGNSKSTNGHGIVADPAAVAAAVGKPAAAAVDEAMDAAAASLTLEQVALIQETWAAVENLGRLNVGVLFFDNIFEAAPAAMDLFR
mmetsp:Transcript_27726/g.88002  ORF Transcript_27726/g.88002 Transcript_27726/m.88002 type:complete len:88 (+) Transcript_27726:111-374(+)